MACSRWTSTLFSPGSFAALSAPASSLSVSSTLGSSSGRVNVALVTWSDGTNPRRWHFRSIAVGVRLRVWAITSMGVFASISFLSWASSSACQGIPLVIGFQPTEGWEGVLLKIFAL